MSITTTKTSLPSWLRRAVPALMVAATMAASPIATVYAQPPAPDNTKVNKRDRQPTQATADDQKNNDADLKITQQIRKALSADKALSTYAHNVKVITQGGKVTLKGPVRSAEEKKVVEAKAAEVAGAANITNQLSVASGATSKKAGS
jgi:hyperosmotically inducible periplasmic protein